MTRTASALGLALSLTGCYATHSVGDDEDVGRDAAALDARALDARTGRDAAPLDAGRFDASRDAPDPGDAFCLPNPDDHVVLACVLNATGVIPAMRESTLSLDRSACVCAAQRSCSVRVEGDILRVETRSCIEDVECDSCDSDQACTVPPLPAGPYRLVVDGLEVYTLNVGGGDAMTPGPRCYRMPAPYSELSDDFCIAPRAVNGFTQECHRHLEDVGARATITVTSQCLDCNLWTGGCEARVEGTRIILSPRLQDCTCTMRGCSGACAACATHEVVCTTPALRAGNYTIEAPVRGVFGNLQVEDVSSPSPISCVNFRR